MTEAHSPLEHETPELKRALDEGETKELPDNRPPGLLGERPVDLHKTESYQYPENAGFVNEDSAVVRWMLIVVLYLLVITGPIAIWLLWRDRAWSTRQKILITVLMVAGYAAVAWKVLG